MSANALAVVGVPTLAGLRRERGRAPVVAAVVLLAMAGLELGRVHTPAVFRHATASSASSAASTPLWPVGLREAARGALGANAYRFAPGADGSWATATPTQGLRSRFDATGPTLASAGDGWQLSLRLARLGRPDAMAPVEAAEVVGSAQGVEYRRGPALTEWYRNDARGLEQGFTLARPPVAGPGPVTLELESSSPALALSRDGADVVGTRADGGPALRYGGLEVTDATGRHLPASLGLEGHAVSLSVADAGAVYPLVVDPWFQQAKLVASGAAASDRFGWSVAVSGNTALVGAPFDDLGEGSVRVFVRSAGTWVETQTLTSSNSALGGTFGDSVAISGNTAVVGALDDTTAGINGGSAYVFVRSGGTWAQQQKLTPNDPLAASRFGTAVAISGNTVVVGAPYHPTDAAINGGSAYVFVRSGVTWTQQQKLAAGDASDFDSFGTSVAVSGATAVVGAYLDDTAGGSDAGSAYVFARSGATWAQTAQLFASSPAPDDEFGISVAIWGRTAIAGAPGRFLGGGTYGGSAYVFVRSTGTWTQQQQLIASDSAALDRFGFAVAIMGSTAVVGAPADDTAVGRDAGSATVFERSGSTWTETQQFTASDAFDEFGSSVAVWKGRTVVVGAPWNDTAGSAAGSAYVFAR